MGRPTVGVIGVGRVGTVIATRLAAAGYPVAVNARSETARTRIAATLEAVEMVTIEELAERSDLLVLAVPDDALPALVADLAPFIKPGAAALHTSGRHGIQTLFPLREAGARTLALHPAMTFTGNPGDVERRCAWGVTAEEPDRALATELVQVFGGQIVWIEEQDRAKYHAGIAHGANHLVTLVAQSMDLLGDIAGPTDDVGSLLGPLLQTALDNVLELGDDALTGPIARGDVQTVAAHIAALSDVSDSTRNSYRAMALATVARAEADQRLDAPDADRIRSAVSSEVTR